MMLGGGGSIFDLRAERWEFQLSGFISPIEVAYGRLLKILSSSLLIAVVIIEGDSGYKQKAESLSTKIGGVKQAPDQTKNKKEMMVWSSGFPTIESDPILCLLFALRYD